MAYLPPSQKKQEELQAAPQIERPASSVAPTAPSGGAAPVVATPAPAQEGSGSAFPGVQAFLQANRGGAMDKVVEGRKNAALAGARDVFGMDQTAAQAAAGTWDKFTTPGGPQTQDQKDAAWKAYGDASANGRDLALARMDKAGDVSNRWDRAALGARTPQANPYGVPAPQAPSATDLFPGVRGALANPEGVKDRFTEQGPITPMWDAGAPFIGVGLPGSGPLPSLNLEGSNGINPVGDVPGATVPLANISVPPPRKGKWTYPAERYNKGDKVRP